MNLNSFLKTYVESIPQYTVNDSDKKCITYEGIKKFIFQRLTSTKYRGSAMPDDLKQFVKQRIDYSVDNKIPIHIVFPFGAYKKWNLPTYPHIDWAEVFNIKYMIEYLSSIATAYKYGVILEYYSVELFVERNSHIPQKDLDIYEKEFKQIINTLSKYAPSALKIKLTNLREEISQQEALSAVVIKAKEFRENWVNISEEEKALKIKRAKVSCAIDENDPNYEATILDAVFVHDAFSSECWTDNGKVEWINKPDMIVVGNSYTSNWGVHIRSSRASRVNFWVGTGILEKRENEFIPSILSYEQWREKQELIEYHTVNILEEFPKLREIGVRKHET